MANTPRARFRRQVRNFTLIWIGITFIMGVTTFIAIYAAYGTLTGTSTGDSLRNVLFDMKVPLFLVVGVRSYHAHKEGTSTDSCPIYTEPIMRAWQIPYTLLDRHSTGDDIAAAYQKCQTEHRARAVLIAE